MANKNITMKQYNGVDWDTLYPKTIIGQIEGLQTALATKAESTHTHTSAQVTGLGTAATKNTGVAQGDIPLLGTGGKLDSSLLPAYPVTSVAGRTGAVVLTKADVGLSNVTNEAKATMFASPAFTGTPTAPTASTGTNTTQLATTAFVTAAVTTVTSSMPKITVSSTAPAGSANGDFWYEVVN